MGGALCGPNCGWCGMCSAAWEREPEDEDEDEREEDGVSVAVVVPDDDGDLEPPF